MKARYRAQAFAMVAFVGGADTGQHARLSSRTQGFHRFAHRRISFTTAMTAPAIALRLSAAIGLGAAVAISGCASHTAGAGAYVEITSGPYDLWRYPSAYDDGRVVYLVDGHWIYTRNGRWFTYRRGPVYSHPGFRLRPPPGHLVHPPPGPPRGPHLGPPGPHSHPRYDHAPPRHRRI